MGCKIFKNYPTPTNGNATLTTEKIAVAAIEFAMICNSKAPRESCVHIDMNVEIIAIIITRSNTASDCIPLDVICKNKNTIPAVKIIIITLGSKIFRLLNSILNIDAIRFGRETKSAYDSRILTANAKVKKLKIGELEYTGAVELRSESISVNGIISAKYDVICVEKIKRTYPPIPQAAALPQVT